MDAWSLVIKDTPRHGRTIQDYDDSDLSGPNYVDHFSLREPSSTVKFRGSRVHVYETTNEQIVLEDRVSSKDVRGKPVDEEDNGDSGRRRHNITVKRVPFTSFGLFFLRMLYTLVSTLLFGFLLAFSFQSILFVFIKLTTETRAASREESNPFSVFRVVSTLCSAPRFLYGFSSLMAIASTFVMEAATGGNLLRAVIGFPTIVKEAMYCVLLLLIPALTLAGSLFAKSDDIWQHTCYAMLGGVLFMFCIFALAIVWVEVSTCFKLLNVHPDYNGGEEGEVSSVKKFLRNVSRSVLSAKRHVYSAHEQEQYVVTGDDVAPVGGYTFSTKKPTATTKSIYSRIVQFGCPRCMFETIPKRRIYSVEEVQDVIPFITSRTWSLEWMFCMTSRNRKVLTAKGPSALKATQIMSSFACTIIGVLVLILVFVAFLSWMGTAVYYSVVAGGLIILFCLYPMIKSNVTFFQMYRDVKKNDEIMVDYLKAGDDEQEDDNAETQAKTNQERREDTIYFKLWETTRVARPKDWLCYTIVLLEEVLFFLFPFIAFLRLRNYPVAVVFFVISLFSFYRINFNSATILCELGPLNEIQIEEEPGAPARRGFFSRKDSYLGVEKTLVKKARFSEIIGNVSSSNATYYWMWFFGFLTGGFFFLFVQAALSGDGYGDRLPLILVDDYSYPAEDSLQYPSCSLSKGFGLKDLNFTGKENVLLDYSFMSILSYETTDVTNYTLSKFFGEGMMVDEAELVKEYREKVGNDSIDIAFKFFTSPANPELGVVAIRGSQTMFDWLNNLKLWSGAGLVQLVKWITPYGWIWTPILHDLVTFMALIQSDELRSVNYYKVTTDFVNDFKDNYSFLSITGASLGGGLAIISGAQARVRAVALSGLGAELTRNVVVPRISMDDINKYTFDFIPDRDIIARVGGRPRHHQEADCSAPLSDSLMGCHSMFRSFCEISYRCGTVDRPVLCDCHFKFRYPEPEPIGIPTRSFRDACIEQQRAFLDATGSTKTVSWLKE